MGLRSISKRDTDSEHMRAISMKRYPEGYVHPTQQAILELSKTEDLDMLTYRQIAERVGINGRWPDRTARHHAKALEKKGLIKLKRRIVVNLEKVSHPTQQAILALSHSGNIDKLTYAEIADKVGVVGSGRRALVSYHIKQLEERGLLTKRE